MKYAEQCAEQYAELIRLKEQALAGYIVFVALQRGEGPSQPDMHYLFGEWINRPPRLVQRDQSWWLEA